METHGYNIDLETEAEKQRRQKKGHVRVKRRVEKKGPNGEEAWVEETIKASVALVGTRACDRPTTADREGTGCQLFLSKVFSLASAWVWLQLGSDVQQTINRQFQKQWKSGLNQAEQLSPLNVLNEQTKVSSVGQTAAL